MAGDRKLVVFIQKPKVRRYLGRRYERQNEQSLRATNLCIKAWQILYFTGLKYCRCAYFSDVGWVPVCLAEIGTENGYTNVALFTTFTASWMKSSRCSEC